MYDDVPFEFGNGMQVDATLLSNRHSQLVGWTDDVPCAVQSSVILLVAKPRDQRRPSQCFAT